MPSRPVSYALAACLVLISLCILGVYASLPPRQPTEARTAVLTPPRVVEPPKQPQRLPDPPETVLAYAQQRAIQAQLTVLSAIIAAQSRADRNFRLHHPSPTTTVPPVSSR